MTTLVLPKDVLRKKKSEKWRGFPAEVLPLPVAEMDYEIALNIKQTVIKMLEESDTGYLGSCPELFSSFSDFASLRWNWKVNPEWIYTCTDVGVGMVELSRRILKTGDKVLINSPVYLNFYSWISEINCKLVDAPLKRDNYDRMKYSLDLNAIEEGYKNGVKVHYLCNPQNPVGCVHSKEELVAIANLAQKYGVIVLSDEIHAPLTYHEREIGRAHV